MTERNWHHVRIEQWEAAETIKLRYGLGTAFDYAVGGTLLNYVQATAQPSDYAHERSWRVSRMRRMFTAHEIQTHLARIERERQKPRSADGEDDVVDFEDPAAIAQRTRRFEFVKELLTPPALGTS